MKIIKNANITIDQFIDIYRRSNINRPCDNHERMRLMMDNSNLIFTAWIEDKMVGLARCFIDYGWVCYLSDLLVDNDYQKKGIGESLLKKIQSELGQDCQLVLLSAPDAMEYYPKMGFENAHHAFFIKRKNT